MRWTGILLLAGVLASATTSATQIFRCVGEQGEIEYRQLACDAAEPVVIGGRPGTSAATGLRDSERAWLDARTRARTAVAKTGRRPATGRPRSVSQDYRCQRKRRQLDALNADMRRGYRAGRGAKLRRRRRAYEDYLAAFCP